MIFCTESDLYKDNKNNLGGRNIFDLINFDIADAILISDLNLLDNQLKEKLIDSCDVSLGLSLDVLIYIIRESKL